MISVVKITTCSNYLIEDSIVYKLCSKLINITAYRMQPLRTTYENNVMKERIVVKCECITMKNGKPKIGKIVKKNKDH